MPNQEFKVTEINAATGEVFEREATEEELANYESIVTETTSIENSIKAKADARTSALAKLAALGLTEEEIAAL